MPASSLPSIAASQLHIAPPTNQLRVLQVELESVASDLCQLTLSGICLAGPGSGAHGLCAPHHFSSDSATSLAVTLSGWGASSLCSHFSLFCRWKWGSHVQSALSTPASSQATRGCPSSPAPWTVFCDFFLSFRAPCFLFFSCQLSYLSSCFSLLFVTNGLSSLNKWLTFCLYSAFQSLHLHTHYITLQHDKGGMFIVNI